jgi:hypothetical protein
MDATTIGIDLAKSASNCAQDWKYDDLLCHACATSPGASGRRKCTYRHAIRRGRNPNRRARRRPAPAGCQSQDV